jgi:3-deoxy-manno-octulosonate cytidylyltransferase (CMP-KDO synthetase)
MYRIVIPARFGSSRLPGKPLLALGGKPLLQWVYEVACRTSASEIVVATDDERILAAARGFGATALMTDPGHASGTDRIAEVARRQGWPGDAIVVNLQGDEPAMPPELVDQVAGLLVAHHDAHLATLAAPVAGLAEYLDPNAVKVVADGEGRALYFSRAPIPWHRDGATAGGPSRFDGARRHIGLYAYRVDALLRLAALPVSPLEDAEKLEQLRALQHGMEIRIADAVCRPGPDVNTADDLARAIDVLARTAG